MTRPTGSPVPRASSRFRQGRYRVYAASAGVLCLGLAFSPWNSACDGYDSHIYAGELYEQARNCNDNPSSVDVVDGVTPPVPCDPICLILPTYDGDGGTAAYVSTMCPPLPPAADTSQTDPRCPPALAAYNRIDICLDGGGSTNPPDSAAPPATTPDAAAAPVDAAGAVDAGAPDTGT